LAPKYFFPRTATVSYSRDSLLCGGDGRSSPRYVNCRLSASILGIRAMPSTSFLPLYAAAVLDVNILQVCNAGFVVLLHYIMVFSSFQRLSFVRLSVCPCVCKLAEIASSRTQIAGLRPNLHTMIFRGRMHNTVVTATSKLKSIYDGVVFTSVCMTPS